MLYSEITDKIIDSYIKVYYENKASNERKEISETKAANPCKSAQ